MMTACGQGPAGLPRVRARHSSCPSQPFETRTVQMLEGLPVRTEGAEADPPHDCTQTVTAGQHWGGGTRSRVCGGAVPIIGQAMRTVSRLRVCHGPCVGLRHALEVPVHHLTTCASVRVVPRASRYRSACSVHTACIHAVGSAPGSERYTCHGRGVLDPSRASQPEAL